MHGTMSTYVVHNNERYSTVVYYLFYDWFTIFVFNLWWSLNNMNFGGKFGKHKCGCFHSWSKETWVTVDRVEQRTLTVFLCSNIVYILYILYIIVSMSSLYLCHLVMRIKIYSSSQNQLRSPMPEGWEHPKCQIADDFIPMFIYRILFILWLVYNFCFQFMMVLK
jgi:hypothetical protein